MKVAVVHDVFIEFGGAERVLLSLLKLYPRADVYIPLLASKWRNTLEATTKGKIISSLFNYIPLIHSASILLKPFLYVYWEQLDLTEYDLVLSSSHSFSSKSVITGPEALHVSYVHTPPRYLYAEYNETRALRHPFVKILLSPLLSWLRVRDFIGAQRPDVLVANSKTVQTRIKKYYRRESTVVYPPVDIPKKIPKRNPKYFLCVSRLSKQKGIDLAIRTCNKLKEPLMIVGAGSQGEYLRSIAGPTIRFKGWVPDERMHDVYAGAKALIYPSIEEDFGIVPVEAMAHGVPVIAYDSGALKESIVDGKTGVFFAVFTEQSLIQAMVRFTKTRFFSRAIVNQAKKFTKHLFEKNIQSLIDEKSK
ncbi:glycosyltransferase [Patescibacteria group bacterium]|nr:glycosyltransferase [Patescibacteria group bacterium]MBU1472166.1 glycosyltransferase [Patescibacteria group bacterium]MBU2459560.1 glycosyltransferase [Patescibacteria group bacterium]MBU2544199.1 glycosyltransferase [Patescibacteria group bacterium]